jgi:anti-sigma regulatory factor (Ser/Thr protein kinase)
MHSPPPQLSSNGWASRSHLELGAYPTAPGSARGHAANVLRDWRLRQFTDTTEIVVSELVTNSVLATLETSWPGPRPPVRLWLLTDGERVLVCVWDAVVTPPQPHHARPDDESGRGLAIVAALSEQWGHHYPPQAPGGKSTWALITTPWPDQADDRMAGPRLRGQT